MGFIGLRQEADGGGHTVCQGQLHSRRKDDRVEHSTRYSFTRLLPLHPTAMLNLTPSEHEEHEFQINRANFAASRVISMSNSRSNRGGRGGGRGGRGGRGGGRGGRGGGRDQKQRNRPSEKKTSGDEQTGGKRKRDVEPDGGPQVGVRGATIPLVRSTSKKAKTDEGES